MSGGQSSTRQQSLSGLQGSPYSDEAAGRTNAASNIAQDWTKQVMSSPNLFMGQTGEQLYPSGQYGLGFNVDTAMNQLSNQALSFVSGQGAARGRLTPEGASAVAGDALTMVLPQLIPQLTSFGQWQFQLPMNLNTYASNIANANAQTQTAALGGKSEGSGSSWNLGFLSGGAGGPVASAVLGR